MTNTPITPKIMLIRHAEKPVAPVPERGPLDGVDVNGHEDKSSLIVRGWQRAGALTCLFAPTHGPLQDSELATPRHLFAAAPRGKDDTGDSNRPFQTLLPLSEKLRKTININYTKAETQELVAHVEQCEGVVLIAWEHGEIPKIANEIMPNGKSIIPQKWPDNRFDVVWVFDLGADGYGFRQVPQCLLAGDQDAPIE